MLKIWRFNFFFINFRVSINLKQIGVMRKFYLLLALCLSFMMTSCGDEENYDDIIVDYSPVEFYIFVENEDGVDLLNVQNEAALDLNAIILYYKDLNSFLIIYKKVQKVNIQF